MKALMMSFTENVSAFLSESAYTQNGENGDKSKIAGPIAILSFILIVIVGVSCLIFCAKRREKDSIKRQRNGGLINYNIPLGKNLANTGGLQGHLNNVSTGSPDIPEWDKEKNVVTAEKYLTTI